jgi:signal transduction histidine kinase
MTWRHIDRPLIIPVPGPLSDPGQATYRRAVPPPDLPGHPATGNGRDLPVLAAAVKAAASGSRLEATLHDIVLAAVRHVDAEYGALGVLTNDGRRLDRFVVVGMDERDAERIGRLPAGDGLLGLLVDDPAVLMLKDLGQHPASVGFPDGHPPMRSFLGVPVRVGEDVFGNLYLTEKRTGGSFGPADVEIAQALAAVAGLAIGNARLAEQTEVRSRWGQAATEMATALLAGAEPEQVLRSVATRVAALTEADLAGVLAPSVDDAETLTIVAAEGRGAEEVEGVRVPLVGTYIGSAHQAGAARLIDNVNAMPVVGRRAAAVVELTAGYGPALVVPVGNAPDRDLLVAMRATGRAPFSQEDLQLLSTFATRASLALELARAQQRERELRLQADRDRIARDLHDHVVQRIFATALSLDRLSRALAPGNPEAAARLSASVDELDGTMAEIRTAIFELQQADGPEPSTVRRQLTDVVRQVTEGHALQRDVRFRGAVDDLPRELAPDLVAVVRELVTNVVRHADAQRVTVIVSAADEVRVAVTDDGSGLPSVTVRSGLANLADRAERRGGRFSIRTGESGTEVCWIAPRRPAAV